MKKITRILLAIVLVVVFSCLVFNKSPYDNYLGDRCPKCKSTHVGKFFYGLYKPEHEDSATLEKIEKGLLIPGGCVIYDFSPRFRCIDCHFIWGKYILIRKETISTE